MVRCPEGHFYDTAKHPSCPWCAKAREVEQAAAGVPVVFPMGGETRQFPPPPEVAEPAPFPEAMFAPPVAPPETPSRLAAEVAAVPEPTETTDVFPDATAPAHAPATKRLITPDAAVDPVVGWLVCTGGPDKGRDWRLHSERNFIGRSSTMDVPVTGDESISRDRHAILSFDPKRSEFWLQPGESTGLVYLNGQAIYVPQQLRERDTIGLGATSLVFVPFVSAGFEW